MMVSFITHADPKVKGRCQPNVFYRFLLQIWLSCRYPYSELLSVNIVLLFYNMGTNHQSMLAVAAKSHQIALPISKLLFTISVLRAVMDGNPIRNPGAPAV
ncbi:MAG: hypothetical protein ACK6BL_07085, partial [Holosporaceae bacterium]